MFPVAIIHSRLSIPASSLWDLSSFCWLLIKTHKERATERGNLQGRVRENQHVARRQKQEVKGNHKSTYMTDRQVEVKPCPNFKTRSRKCYAFLRRLIYMKEQMPSLISSSREDDVDRITSALKMPRWRTLRYRYNKWKQKRELQSDKS